MARQLSVQPVMLGLMFSVGALGVAAGAIVGGALADRVGPKRMLALFTFCFGVFQFGTGYASDYPSLLTLRVLTGFGLGGAAPCFLALAAGHTSVGRRSTMLGLLWACFPLGALAGGIANGLIVEHLGWRAVFLISGTIPIALAFLLFVTAAETPAYGQRRSAEPFWQSGIPVWWREHQLRSRLLLLWCVFFGTFGALACVVMWMPSILAREGLSATDGGLILSWHALGALVSMALAGFLYERLGARMLVVGLFGGAAFLAATALVLPSFEWVATGMVILGVLFGLAASGAIAAVAAVLPAESRGGGLGWSMGIGRLGQVILPFFMGLGLERTGPVMAFCGLAAIAAVFALAAWRFAVLERRPYITVSSSGSEA